MCVPYCTKTERKGGEKESVEKFYNDKKLILNLYFIYFKNVNYIYTFFRNKLYYYNLIKIINIDASASISSSPSSSSSSFSAFSTHPAPSSSSSQRRSYGGIYQLAELFFLKHKVQM